VAPAPPVKLLLPALLDAAVELLPDALTPVDVDPLLVLAAPLPVAVEALPPKTAAPVSSKRLCGGSGTVSTRLLFARLLDAEDETLAGAVGAQEAAVPAARVVLPTLLAVVLPAARALPVALLLLPVARALPVPLLLPVEAVLPAVLAALTDPVEPVPLLADDVAAPLDVAVLLLEPADP
jgi:hypothetical protein